MTNESMLDLIRLDRPKQVIHEVLSFKLNSHNLYEVSVRMENDVLGTKIKNHHITLPYPLSRYNELRSMVHVDMNETHIIEQVSDKSLKEISYFLNNAFGENVSIELIKSIVKEVYVDQNANDDGFENYWQYLSQNKL